MDSRKMQEYVEIELNQYDPDYGTTWKLQSRELFYYLNRSQRDYVQEIYDSGVDKSEANKRKLGSLFQNTSITGLNITDNSSSYPNSYVVTLPSGIMYVTNERVNMTTKTSGASLTDIYVKPISYDTYNVNKDNPFRKSNYGKCLRFDLNGNHVVIVHDSVLNTVKLDYIKTPEEITLTQDSELHESVHYNIINGAVKLILASKRDQVGYQIQSIEQKENK